MDTVKLASLKGNAFDVEFIKQMIQHHDGAVEMAMALKTDSKYPELENLAKSVIESQSAEIEEMKGLLAAWSATQN